MAWDYEAEREAARVALFTLQNNMTPTEAFISHFGEEEYEDTLPNK